VTEVNVVQVLGKQPFRATQRAWSLPAQSNQPMAKKVI
jgi:hypothetical protein